ncbi:hypothetical protein ACQEVC_28155 [Plantactinospora sp. CA-294935]|uniref:hypothetical protein n=1 Tax=Plantactinospora sp. CA-294935 TaxID=3240012 RepID=UPI003D8A5CB5
MTRSTTLLRKIGWTLLTGFIGFAGSALLDEVLGVTLADQLIITIVIGGVTLLAQYLVDMERRFAAAEQLQTETTEGLRHMIQRGFESVDEATELMAELEQSAVRHELLKQVIRRSAHLTQAGPPLCRPWRRARPRGSPIPYSRSPTATRSSTTARTGSSCLP